ncbi:MAG TPA: LmeA family phospholipid-binding protein [Solirubrobacteraceae bacterium]|nr:LmeA family phospholipid-binding protein [Solirubrobacteraceae bacterium]
MRRRDGSGSRAVRVGLWLAGVLVVLLGLAQLFLPKLAASRISSRIGKYGSVDSVHVSAFPAIELLWKRADSVHVRATRLRISPAQTGKLLDEAGAADRLDVNVASVQEGPLSLSDVSLHKRGSEMSAQGHVSEADVQAALPPGFGVQLLGSKDGEVEVSASGGLFGIGASVDAVASADEGKLVVHPRGPLIEALKLTLFSDPRVYVEGVSAAATTGADGAPGYVLGITAQLR